MNHFIVFLELFHIFLCCILYNNINRSRGMTQKVTTKSRQAENVTEKKTSVFQRKATTVTNKDVLKLFFSQIKELKIFKRNLDQMLIKKVHHYHFYMILINLKKQLKMHYVLHTWLI